MAIYGHRFDNLRTDLHPELVQEGIVDAFKSVIESIKKGIVNLIDKINGWLDKHPDSKVTMGLKSILTKLKNLLTKADNIKSKEDAEEVKEEVDKNKEEAEDLMKETNISPEFVQNVEKGDITTIRSTLLDYLIIDTTFKKFDKSFEYAKSKIPDLVEDFTEKNCGPIDSNKSNWDEKYLNKCKVYLMTNFSIKRINHLKEVIKNVL